MEDDQKYSDSFRGARADNEQSGQPKKSPDKRRRGRPAKKIDLVELEKLASMQVPTTRSLVTLSSIAARLRAKRSSVNFAKPSSAGKPKDGSRFAGDSFKRLNPTNREAWPQRSI